ncbi:hypothetical protein AVW15_06160 [Chelatococcus daeguensis]|nr:hypothetical protein AVW15_06160 [Chelatococcus daeguensis]
MGVMCSRPDVKKDQIMQGYDPRFGPQMRIVRLSRWQLWLAAAVGLALVVTLAIVAAGVFLVVLPVVVVAGLGYHLWMKWRGQRPGGRAGDMVIDAEYSIVRREDERHIDARGAPEDRR